jgi:hypothetical protein
MSEFYVGYLPKAPERLRRTIIRTIFALTGLAAIVAILLVLNQRPFADSRFEYLHYAEYEGVIVNSPYPSLLTASGQFLLVAPGKYGAAGLTGELNLQNVQLRGSRIELGGDRMLEIVPGSIRVVSRRAVSLDRTSLGKATFAGEIVDSKCYFGVMNPGAGKVHRDCAVRCISGGIPPAIIVRDSSGKLRTLLLASTSRHNLNHELLNFIGEPVEISGHLVRYGEALVLETEPAAIRRTAAARE